MKFLSAVSFALLFISCLAQSETTVNTTSVQTSPNPTTEPATSEGTTGGSSPVTTPPPPTSPPTTQPTSPPTTASEPPVTTPENPTTASSDETTAAIVTTREPIITTTRAPIPEPEEGSWNVTSGNTTCIRAELKILFKISTGEREDYITLNPNASSALSSCQTSNTTQELVLTDSNYELRFIFEKSNGDSYVRNISFVYMLPVGSETVANNTRLWNVKEGNSYMCRQMEDVMLQNVTMEIMSIRLQAFGSAGNTDYGDAEECPADNKVNDIVPIAVGVALLALVTIVLVAYLIGRRRSRQKGYQSV